MSPEQPISFSPYDASGLIIGIGHFIANSAPIVFDFLKHVFAVIFTISFPISVFLLIGIIYCVERLKAIRNKEAEIHDLKTEPSYDTVNTVDLTTSNRWQSAMNHINSSNQNDWKQAILEADIILDDLLTRMGYRGESIGEKLKRAQPTDFKSLNEAWEAHKIRNQIAHEGSDFSLNQHEAKRIIHLYRKVFEEFYYIQ